MVGACAGRKEKGDECGDNGRDPADSGTEGMKAIFMRTSFMVPQYVDDVERDCKKNAGPRLSCLNINTWSMSCYWTISTFGSYSVRAQIRPINIIKF